MIDKLLAGLLLMSLSASASMDEGGLEPAPELAGGCVEDACPRGGEADLRMTDADYARTRAWFAYVAPLIARNLTPETDPILALDREAANSRANAERGLMMAVSDALLSIGDKPAPEVQLIDQGLQAEQLSSVAEMKSRVSEIVQRALRRGRIFGDVEYYAVVNAAENPSGDQDRLIELVAGYEEEMSSPDGGAQ